MRTEYKIPGASVAAGGSITQLRLYLHEIFDQFEQRFSEMLTHYPTKRSVLVPTLLYAQDEIGHLNDEVIAEIAGR